MVESRDTKQTSMGLPTVDFHQHLSHQLNLHEQKSNLKTRSDVALLGANCRFGQARQDAEKLVRSFQDVYSLRRMSVNGDEVRLLHCYPGPWQVCTITNHSTMLRMH